MSIISSKKIRAILVSAVVAATAFSQPVWAKDPCKTMMCMWGKVGSDGSSLEGSESDCKGAIADFFGIVVKKHGDFKASATSDAREQFINSCQGATENEDVVSGIITKFGKQRKL